MLTKLKFFLKEQKIDFFFLPNSDEFFSEYLPESEKRIQYLTGFSGSSAMVIFGLEKSYFFTDGRYILQAKQQLDLNEFEIFNIAEKPLPTWLEENLHSGKKLALDAKLSNLNFVEFCKEIAADGSASLVLLDSNPVDEIWKNRPLRLFSEIFFCDEKKSGRDSMAKRAQVLQRFNADALIITKPENLCWLLNVRAADIEFTPLLLAYGILFKNGDVEIFVDEKRLHKISADNLPKITALKPELFSARISELRKKIKKIQIDARSTNYWLYKLLEKENFEIISENDRIEILKSCKNKIEIEGAIKSHQLDGLALTKFLFWIDKAAKNKEKIDEIKAEEKLLEFRKNQRGFLYPSFASISSFGPNGAVVHYHASSETNRKISGDSLYLIDSGGQYFGEDFCGTTDVTRTIAIGKASSEMIENFTRVLKGHIALARAQFPVGTSGASLDALARFHLWQNKKDYEHGTGHGVGSFLSVHEGPCAISKRVSSQAILPGMILSNEPGFYKENEYGIRIESLLLVEKCDEKFLRFRTLTLAPIDPNLIDFSMLNYEEKIWLKEYHETVLSQLASGLAVDEKNWLALLVKKFDDSLRQ
jgi:Xaa-Pro aminopeptidase